MNNVSPKSNSENDNGPFPSLSPPAAAFAAACRFAALVSPVETYLYVNKPFTDEMLLDAVERRWKDRKAIPIN